VEQTEIDKWLQTVKGVLIQEGFSDTILQVKEPGQVFGLVKRLDKVWEMHVRGFNDGRLKAEIEVARDFFEHLNNKYRRDATPELLQILDAYQVPYEFEGNLPQVAVTLDPPQQLTPWKPVVVIVALAVFLSWLGQRE
jgi:hypothetical protein